MNGATKSAINVFVRIKIINRSIIKQMEVNIQSSRKQSSRKNQTDTASLENRRF